jgi:hypothetical protein
MGMPGCPEFAACTASMDKARIALAIWVCEIVIIYLTDCQISDEENTRFMAAQCTFAALSSSGLYDFMRNHFFGFKKLF